MRLQYSIRWLLTFFVILALVLPLIGRPVRHAAGWCGKGWIITWHALDLDDRFYFAIWTEPTRTGIPLDVAISIVPAR